MKTFNYSRLLITSILLTFIVVTYSCSSTKSSIGFYELQVTPVSIGVGFEIVKSWGKAKKVSQAKEEAKRNAVYQIIFKGVGSPPLVKDANAEQKYREYFDAFFADNGKYEKFVEFTTPGGSIAPSDRIKDRKLYLIGVSVKVSINSLKTELETAGIYKFGI